MFKMERISVSAGAREAQKMSARQVQTRPAAGGFRVDRVQAGPERADTAQSSVSISGRARAVSAISNMQSRPEAAEALLAMIRSAGVPKPEPLSASRQELVTRRQEPVASRAGSEMSGPEPPTRRRISIYVY